MAGLVVALDIGTTKVCALVAEVTGGSWRLIGSGMAPCAGLRRGAVIDVQGTVTAIESAIDQAAQAAGVEIHQVVVGVTGEHIASLNARGVVAILGPDGEVLPSDVERVLDSARLIVLPPDREIVHVVPRFFTLDGQEGIKNPLGMCGSRLEVEAHIVTGTTALLRNVAICVEKAGLQIEDLVLEPLASGDAVLLPAERELGVALIDIGGGTADIVLFRQGEICHSSVVPIGGALVTRDCAAFLRTSLEEAERIKCSVGHVEPLAVRESEVVTYTTLDGSSEGSLSRRALAEVIEARSSEMLQLVRRELLRSGLADALPTGAVLCGGGSLLPGLDRLAGRILELPIRLASVPGVPSAISSPTFATATGLIQWGARQYRSMPRPLSKGVSRGWLPRWMRLTKHWFR